MSNDTNTAHCSVASSPLIALAQTVYLEPTAIPAERRRRLRALGTASFSKGDREGLKLAFKELRKELEEERAGKRRAVKEAARAAREKGASREDVYRAKAEAAKGAASDIRATKEALGELRVYRDLLYKDASSALAKQIVEFRATTTVAAINKAIANKGTLPAPARQ